MVHFHETFSQEAVHSYTNNVRCCGRDSSIGSVYYAEITQHHKGSSSLVDAYGGVSYLPSPFTVYSRSTRNNARLSSTLAFAFSFRSSTWSLVRILLRSKPTIADLSKAFVVQGHRFDIYEQIGCFPVIYNTIPAFFLVHMWPIVLGLCSAWFCGASSPSPIPLRI